MKRFLWVVAILVALALGYLASVQLRPTKEAAPEAQVAASPSQAQGTVTTVTSGKPPSPPSKEGVSPPFLLFLNQEARSLDAPKVNADQAEQRVREQAAGMGPAEMQYAKDLALSGVGAANEGILAVYLLGAALPKSSAYLRETILWPVPNSGRAEPHSVDEVKNVQERAKRLMAIDAFAERAVKEQWARDELTRLQAEVQDSSLKSYIQKKLSELPAL